MKTIRLDKFLSDAGIGTRSEVKKYIYWNRVMVNGRIVKDAGYKVQPDTDQVSYQGKMVGTTEEFVYYLLHKPAGCISATEDKKQKTVLAYVPDTKKDLFPVGRLDKDTEGLLLITNDGMLAHKLLSPKKHVPKTYYAILNGKVTEEDKIKIEKGLDIGDEKPALPAKLKILETSEEEEGWTSKVEITICEGRYHQVKRMMEAVGKKVTYLKRLSMGNLILPESLEKGNYIELSKEKINQLFSL